MSDLQILDDEEESYEFMGKEEQPDIDYLKGLKETSQVFLRVNNFEIDEPDFRDLTEEEFIEFMEENTNPEILKKFNSLNIPEDFRSSMSNVYRSKDEKNNIFIYFLPTSSQKTNVGIDVIKSFCKLIVLLGCNEGVMISEKPLTSKSRESVESSNVKSYCPRDQVYNVISYTDDMFINVVDHCLTPEVLKIYSGEELEEFLEKEGMKRNHFPKMIISDPIAKFYRARVGDVIKMKRKTGNRDTLINEQIVYRAVVYGITKKK